MVGAGDEARLDLAIMRWVADAEYFALALFAFVATSSVVSDSVLKGLASLILGLGVLRGLLSFSSRFALFRMAYELEFDLRNILFEHLARLPFGFYDRVQSGFPHTSLRHGVGQLVP